MDTEEPLLFTVYCPYDDRPYQGLTKKAAEDIAKKHVQQQHPDRPNPFESAED